MRNTRTRNIAYTAICIALAILLPQINKLIPIANIGAMIAPMHIAALLAGFLCGLPYATIAGLLMPLVAFILTGMPPIYPVGLAMMFELCAYATVTALLYKYTKGKVFVSLIAGMLAGRVVLGIANTIIFGFAGIPYSMKLFLTSAFVTILPGIIIQLLIIPSIVFGLRKAKLLD